MYKEGGVACCLHSNTDLSIAFPITPPSIPSLTPMWHHPLMSSFLLLVHQDEPEIITHQTLSGNRSSLARWLCPFFFLLIKDSELLSKWNSHLAIEFQCNFIMQQIKFAFWMWLSHLWCVLLLIWTDFFFGGWFFRQVLLSQLTCNLPFAETEFFQVRLTKKTVIHDLGPFLSKHPRLFDHNSL